MIKPNRTSTLYLASANPGKLREFQEAASSAGISVEMLPGFSRLPPCVEDGKTFEDNARKKALHYSPFVSGLVLADDSGLVVDALAGRPGVYSARYSGPGATDESNNRRLIGELSLIAATHPPEDFGFSADPSSVRGFHAHYVCALAVAEGSQCVAVTEGRVDGMILEAPRGTGGFGYDPHFYYPPFRKTFAEVSAGEKYAVSHRGIAFRKLLDCLAQRCSTSGAARRCD